MSLRWAVLEINIRSSEHVFVKLAKVIESSFTISKSCAFEVVLDK